MPLLKHAKKKLKQDKVRTARNKKIKDLFKKLVKEARETKTAEAVSKAFSSIDRAAKQNIVPKNKAAHMKASLTRFVEGRAPSAGPAKKVVAKRVKGAAKKKISKAKK